MRIQVLVQDDSLPQNSPQTAEILSLYAQAAIALIRERKMSGETIQEVSKGSGVWHQNISRIEHGSVQAMSLHNVSRLAKYFGVEDEVLPLMRKAIGMKMTQKREKKHITSLRSAAKQVGISHQRLSEIENGFDGNDEALTVYSRFLKVKV